MPAATMKRDGRRRLGTAGQWLAAVAALGMLLLLAQAAYVFSHRPQFDGGMISLPAQVYDFKPGDRPRILYSFDGAYPVHWPAELVLPPGSYIVCRTGVQWASPDTVGRGALVCLSGSMPEAYEISGVCPGSQAQVMQHFSTCGSKLGLILKPARYRGSQLEPALKQFGSLQTCHGTEYFVDSFEVTAHEYKLMRGYCTYDLSIVLRDPAQPSTEAPLASQR